MNKKEINHSCDASDFVSLGEVIPDVITEIRYYTSFNFIGDRIEGYEAPLAILTLEAAQALKDVSEEAMRKGYRLRIFDAYRPQKAVDHFMRWAEDPQDIRMKEYFYPSLAKEILIPQGYIAPLSGHTRGSTVDLTLFDMEKHRDADMGGPFDLFGEISHPDYRGVSDEQHENRMLLRSLMMNHGFRGIDEEWWHFTLKNEPYPDTYFTFPISFGTLHQIKRTQ
ncbi:MAG: peptidase M15 [Erysipelotrichaceae bacterium]|nr:peptidase M15 [Erysipelotrichaceae bacterium]